MRILIAFCLLVVGPAVGAEEQASTTFATLAAARAGNVFKEGLLPTWLPPSTHDIQIRRPPAAQYSGGQFYIEPKDLSEFDSRVRYCGTWFEPPDKVRNEIGDYRTTKEQIYQDYDDHVVWLFACGRDGLCRFWQWHQPSDA